MRVKRGRNPKGMTLTPEQEAEYERYEMVLARVRILELGVASMLNLSGGSYLTGLEVAEASKVLAEAVALRQDAQSGREAIRKAANHELSRQRYGIEAVPAPAKRKAAKR